MTTRTRPVVLLVAEAVTLAHFARIVTLARSLDPQRYEIHVASDPRFLHLEQPFEFSFHPIHSIPCADFAHALAKGNPLYKARTLSGYVDEDLRLLDAVNPDLVVGDFRLSLAVSAPLKQVPYASVVNAYWSPYANTAYPIPDLPVTRILGVGLGQKLFDLIRPLVFGLHAVPLNRVRRSHGLSPIGSDLRTVYSWGDYTLYADMPELVTMWHLPDNHRFLGPVNWSTNTPLPEWWHTLPEDRPVVFVTLGSSGRADLLPLVVDAMAGLPVTVIAATAGRSEQRDFPANARVTDYLPADAATRRASLVVCNGGSLTTYQSLAEGVPVIGLTSNMDQLLNMQALERVGAGLMLRAAQVRSTDVTRAVSRVLEDVSFTHAAKRTAESLARCDAGRAFVDIVDGILYTRG